MRFFPLLVLAGVIGCSGDPEAELASPSAPPPAPDFAGQPDPKLAAVYKQEGADLTMTLFAEGKVTTKGKINARGNIIEVDSEGRWAVDGDNFYTETPDAKGEKRVNRRTWQLEKDRLVLTSSMLPNPTIYLKIGPAPK